MVLLTSGVGILLLLSLEHLLCVLAEALDITELLPVLVESQRLGRVLVALPQGILIAIRSLDTHFVHSRPIAIDIIVTILLLIILAILI